MKNEVIEVLVEFVLTKFYLRNIQCNSNVEILFSSSEEREF